MTIRLRSFAWILTLSSLGGVAAQDPDDSSQLLSANRLPVVATAFQMPVPSDPQQEFSDRLHDSNADAKDGAQDSSIQLIVGRGRILTTPSPIVAEGDVAVVAVGDPTIADFEVLPNPRMLRLTGKRPGITDLTMVTSDEQILVYELNVQYDLRLVEARLQQAFPGALVKISQLGTNLILEGQARDQIQSAMIESTVRAYLDSLQNTGSTRQSAGTAPTTAEMLPDTSDEIVADDPVDVARLLLALPEATSRSQRTSSTNSQDSQIINLIRLPGVQQVMLQVRIAELNRTAMREIGADTFFEWGPGNILGSQIAGASPASLKQGGIPNPIGPDLGPNSTAFGIFPTGRIEIILRALRQNSLVRVLAEPNLVALSGHEASFLAGGEFPVPVSQGNAIGGIGNTTVRFKEFGVQLNFVPQILDNDVIRLEVRPEVSTIDPSLGINLVVGGRPTPGINTRRVHTTVQMREGESLALAGLLQVTLDANTNRIPGLGDLPYLGPLFSNTSHKRVEKELLVLVTPYLVSPLDCHQIPLLPGEEIQDPNDLELYFLSRIEGRTGRDFRSTTAWDDPLHLVRLLKLERDHVCGPVGFTPYPGQIQVSK